MMSDQCAHCVLRGDFEKCTDAVCGHHENWIVVEMNNRMVAATKQERERCAKKADYYSKNSIAARNIADWIRTA